MQETYLILCLVARSNAASSSGGTKLSRMCQAHQTWKGATSQHSIAQVSMASCRNRSIRIEQNNYLLVVDYFSRYPEVVKLTSTTSATIISVLKNIFARHGIPEVLGSDNGPQYASAVYDLCKFIWIPTYHQQSQISRVMGKQSGVCRQSKIC